jgi:hypothetical protein
VRGSNARDLSVQLSLPQLPQHYVFLIITCIYSSTKLKKRAEQVLPGSEGGGQGQEGEMAQI